MRKTLAWSLTLGLLLSFTPAFGQDQAAAPSYRDGDSWQFNVVEKGSTSSSTRGLDGDYRVLFKGGEVRVVPVNQEKSEFKQNVAQLKRMLALEDKEQLLQFPLALNSKWTADFQNALGSGVSQAVHAEMSVAGYEEVTTGAGKIAAFKIERYETFRSGGRRAATLPPICVIVSISIFIARRLAVSLNFIAKNRAAPPTTLN
jgi:hypothetical protein